MVGINPLKASEYEWWARVFGWRKAVLAPLTRLLQDMQAVPNIYRSLLGSHQVDVYIGSKGGESGIIDNNATVPLPQAKK